SSACRSRSSRGAQPNESRKGKRIISPNQREVAALRSSFTKIPLLPIALLILLTGVATSFVKHTSAQTIAQARVHAPELTGGRGWLNTDKPLTLAALRGKIVLLDFWTYGCINCLRTIPD